MQRISWLKWFLFALLTFTIAFIYLMIAKFYDFIHVKNYEYHNTRGIIENIIEHESVSKSSLNHMKEGKNQSSNSNNVEMSNTSNKTKSTNQAFNRFWLFDSSNERTVTFPFEWIELPINQVILKQEMPQRSNFPCASGPNLIGRKSLKKFLFRNKRTPYRLIDLSLLIEEQKKKNHSHIMIIGDSLQEELFNLGMCELARSEEVEYVMNSRKSLKVRVRDMKSRDYHSNIGWLWTVSFLIKHHHSVKYTFVRNDHPLTDRVALNVLCESSDIVMFNWGVHYSNPFTDAGYVRDVTPALSVLRNCSKSASRTTIVYASQPAQHFNTSNGWFESFNDHACVPLRVTAEIGDGWGKVVRETIAKSLKMNFIPVPWEHRICPSKYLKDENVGNLFWIPYYDATESLWDYHRKSFSDCTHRAVYAEWGIPIWDGLFLAQYLNFKCEAKSCFRSMCDADSGEFEFPSIPSAYKTNERYFTKFHDQLWANPGGLENWVHKNFTPQFSALQKLIEDRNLMHV